MGTGCKKNIPDLGTGGKKNNLIAAVQKSSEIKEGKTEICAPQQSSNDEEPSHHMYVARDANEIIDQEE